MSSTVWYQMRFPRFPVLSALVLVLVAGTAATVPAHADPSGDPVTSGAGAVISGLRLTEQKTSVEARRALDTAADVLAPKTGRKAERALNGRDADATMALTSLFVHRDEMSASDQTKAARLVARPAAGKRVCSTKVPVCIHWVTRGDDKSTWSWVKTVRGVMEHVYATYKRAGYRRPVGDGAVGGKHNYVDIYLRDVYDQGYYGYCAPAGEPASAPKGSTTAKAYCVLDNDYARSQYGRTHTPVQNLKVTAAHEFFHAIQFAYDAGEDLWLMEGTAVWAEDEIYTGINDNLQYLPYGQLRRPRTALDKTTTYGVYGNWIFFRYLSERFPRKAGGLPAIVRQIWRHADSTRGKARNDYSIKAVADAISDHKTLLRTIYLQFAEANHHSQRAYREGRANDYPVAPVTKSVTLRPLAKRASGTYTLTHLTSAATRFVPVNVGGRMRVQVHLARPGMQAAIVTVYLRSGALRKFPIRVNGKGTGSVTVPFATTKVSKAELTMVNASRSYRCWKGTGLSCHGIAKYNAMKTSWSGTLV